MKAKLMLWAQALDNASPDHFEIDGCAVAAADTATRESIVHTAAKISKNGVVTFKANGVSLTTSRGDFIIQANSDSNDEDGRIAPIICVISHADSAPPFGNDVAETMNRFALGIGRNLQAGHIGLVKSAIDTKLNSDEVRRSDWLVSILLSLFARLLKIFR